MLGKVSRNNPDEIDDAVLTVTERDATQMEWPLRRRIVFWYFAVGALVLLGLFMRTGYLGIVEGEKYARMAKRNSIREIPVPAPRGIIYDRFGEPLVRNTPSIGAVLVPFDLPAEEGERTHLRARIRSVLHVEEGVIDSAFQLAADDPYAPILLREKLSQEEMIDFIANRKEFSGVSLFKSVYREYPDGLIFSHIIGYEGKITQEEWPDLSGYLPTDLIGKQGIEKSYESSLRGKRGYERVEVDALGRVKKTLGTVMPEQGDDLFLHVDAGLQKTLYDTLSAQLEKEGLPNGAAIALDPRDGSVLALVSVPGFDNNLFSEGISGEAYRSLIEDPARPLFNRAIGGEYAPGSTFKPVVATAALAEGVIDEHRQIESKGGISVGSFFFGDWKAHGFTDMRAAIAVSSDVYFYSIGGGYGGVEGLGIERIKSYAERFGYGTPSGIDVPGEADGFLPDPEWKRERFDERWYIGDDYNSSIGQGYVTATPLQILSATAAIANGGTLPVPRLVSHTRDGDGTTSMVGREVVRRDIVSDDMLRIVREGMRQTVTEGTAQSLTSLPLPVAGKTGTAQFGGEEKTHGWFVSFAPYDEPTIAMIVLIEGQGEETYNAVPVTRAVYEWYFRERLGAEE